MVNKTAPKGENAKAGMDIKDFVQVIKKKITGKDDAALLTGQTGKYEVNLVPEIKLKMIKTQKTRNLVLFICIVIVSVCGGIVALLGSVVAGQAVSLASKDGHLEQLSTTVMGYDELSEFLTIQDQLNKISKIEDNKKVLSRVFPILASLLPTGKDTVTLSELNVNLEEYTLSFDAQANAGEAPLIDYRVLESFKKSVNSMNYDYGRYVDAEGREIPTRCIEETDKDGNMYSKNGAIYAIWKRGEEGCDPGRDDYTEDGTEKKTTVNNIIRNETIWRTPQFDTWHKGEQVKTRDDQLYKDDKKEKEDEEDEKVLENVTTYVYTPSMSLSGQIDGVPHFETECIVYTGEQASDKTIKWSAENTCKMAQEDIVIGSSSNGRDADGNLVLRFSAVISIDPDVFAFRKKHVMVITPYRKNMTDSYVQVENMFAAPAADCEVGDKACFDDKNSTGE